MTRSAVVVNPAKVDDLAARRREICDELAQAGWPEPLWFETTEDDPGRGQARRAVEAGAEVVFVCGGDGTVMATLSVLAGTDVAMCVLPSGTGNLLARNLGLPDDAAAGVRLATRGERRRIDVGRVDDQYFAVMAGIGFDARMIQDADHRAKARWGWPAYVFSALRHLRDDPIEFSIRLDRGQELTRRAQAVLISNVGRLQGGVVLLPEAEPDDACLDVAVLTPRRPRDWLVMALRLLFRRAPGQHVETFRARHVEVTTAAPQPCELDGDEIDPRRQLVVDIAPSALLLCVARAGRTGDLEEAA
ncbi:MAG TPA: diacylglycerol kinase family protein [Mycobacteriales bacterium]|jgi:diacylglycerol kinase family enzyme|nr:diacylglycerol kinase family protein [Mycobacteriales bacterium]